MTRLLLCSVFRANPKHTLRLLAINKAALPSLFTSSKQHSILGRTSSLLQIHLQTSPHVTNQPDWLFYYININFNVYCKNIKQFNLGFFSFYKYIYSPLKQHLFSRTSYMLHLHTSCSIGLTRICLLPEKKSIAPVKNMSFDINFDIPFKRTQDFHLSHGCNFFREAQSHWSGGDRTGNDWFKRVFL